MRVAANLSMMYGDLELIERYARAAREGFRLVEVSLPYSVDATELKRAADEHNLQHVLINAPAGDWNHGFRGLACLPGHEQQFKESIQEALRYARTLKCSKIHVMAGIRPEHHSESQLFHLFLDNLRHACTEMAVHGITCLIEPISHIAIPNYFLNTVEQATTAIERLAMPNLKLQMDLFHVQQISGSLSHNIRQLRHIIGHIQVAQVPGRHEPNSDGEINYGYVFRLLREIGDPEWVIGCEYLNTNLGLGWVGDNGLNW